jgi:hypothetical protein
MNLKPLFGYATHIFVFNIYCRVQLLHLIGG